MVRWTLRTSLQSPIQYPNDPLDQDPITHPIWGSASRRTLSIGIYSYIVMLEQSIRKVPRSLSREVVSKTLPNPFQKHDWQPKIGSFGLAIGVRTERLSLLGPNHVDERSFIQMNQHVLKSGGEGRFFMRPRSCDTVRHAPPVRRGLLRSISSIHSFLGLCYES